MSSNFRMESDRCFFPHDCLVRITDVLVFFFVFFFVPQSERVQLLVLAAPYAYGGGLEGAKRRFDPPVTLRREALPPATSQKGTYKNTLDGKRVGTACCVRIGSGGSRSRPVTRLMEVTNVRNM